VRSVLTCWAPPPGTVSQLLSLADLVKDKKANQVKLDAVRLGLTIGGSNALAAPPPLIAMLMSLPPRPKGIIGVHQLAYGLLARLRQTEDELNSLISGALSGLPLLFQTKGSSCKNSLCSPYTDLISFAFTENRRTPALYLLTRLVQCIYNELKRRNLYLPFCCNKLT